MTPELDAWVTETDALPLTPLSVAVTLVEPEATPVANPELSMVATAVLAAAQAAVVVTLPVELSLYVAVAVNCCVAPVAKLAVLGVTAIDVTVSAVTVNVALPLTPLRAA